MYKKYKHKSLFSFILKLHILLIDLLKDNWNLAAETKVFLNWNRGWSLRCPKMLAKFQHNVILSFVLGKRYCSYHNRGRSKARRWRFRWEWCRRCPQSKAQRQACLKKVEIVWECHMLHVTNVLPLDLAVSMSFHHAKCNVSYANASSYLYGTFEYGIFQVISSCN